MIFYKNAIRVLLTFMNIFIRLFIINYIILTYTYINMIFFNMFICRFIAACLFQTVLHRLKMTLLEFHHKICPLLYARVSQIYCPALT